MKNAFTLNINTPCQEDFNSFTATANGGFCNACDKEVIDFTTMKKEDINKYFSTKNTQNTCGRFKAGQLDTQQLKPKTYGVLSGVGLACLALFSINLSQAQDTRNQTTKTEMSVPLQDKFLVQGNVSDDLDAIPGVNVVLEGTDIGTVTDINGNFVFPEKLKKGDVLVFSYVGMESQKLTIKDKESASNIALEINMKLDPVIIMGKVAVKEVYKSNRKK
ncbi:carboxypeptidase-like regulatory domain-containing protein [Lacinutrix chionoecetis]